MSQTSDTLEPPAKRQRMEAEAEHLTRSDIWHDDGSVVLQAESTQFRVHWSVLSLHSTFFRDMRSLPQPADQPSIEGCPVIQLHDSSVDVEHLLNALYNPFVSYIKLFVASVDIIIHYRHLFNAKELHLSFIAALVRLGRKYEFRNLLAVAVQRLTHENPTTLQEYESMIQTEDDQLGYLPTQIVPSTSIIFDVLTLARENNLFAVLPCAYFRALFFYTEVRWIQFANFWQLSQFRYWQEEILDDSPEIGPSGALSFQDQRICILAGKKIVQAQWDHTRFEAWMSWDAPAFGCTSTLCILRKKSIFQELLRTGGLPLAPFHTLSGVEEFCNACMRQHRVIIAEERKKLWDDLPGFFGLPPWNELKNDI
ncbi:hypothetical protein B0H19DRAFT_1236564 [Mycena capillaripes]|nr:hypothetical protein B0H19DRAFT_1236564 [Mycena capillaripes]